MTPFGDRTPGPAQNPSPRERFLQEYEQSYATLRTDPQEWAEIQTERGAFDSTLMDGLKQSGD